MKVSIIIPLYNLERYIEKTIVSCLRQTYDNIEVVIVNDGSTDSSASIVSRYLTDHRIIYVEQNNAGVSSARNHGVRICTGDYITFLDGDDLLNEDTIAKNVELIEKSNEAIDWLAFPLLREDEQGYKLSTHNTNLLKAFRYDKVMRLSARQVFELYEKGEFPPIVCSMLFRRSFFDRMFVDGRYEDTYMFLELLSKQADVVLSPNGGYRYVNRSDSFINDEFSPEKWIYYTRSQIKKYHTGLLLYPEQREKYENMLSAAYYNLRYLKFKKRRNKAYAKPLDYLCSEVPTIRKNLGLWLMMVLKCTVSLIH